MQLATYQLAFRTPGIFPARAISLKYNAGYSKLSHVTTRSTCQGTPIFQPDGACVAG